MLFNRDGEILWQRGRGTIGRNVFQGSGFSRTYIDEAIRSGNALERENVMVGPPSQDWSESALILRIKSLIILPIGDDFFLYIDSGVKDAFTATDKEIFRVIGSLLGEMILHVRLKEKEVGGLNGSSESINLVRDLVLRYSLVEEPVLLLGETGVGKTHIAELIHQYSGRRGKFVTVSTPSIPDNLFERELFGHKRGAFTDAHTDKQGYVDEAAGGTIFFDEISEIPLSFQAKLLRFIDTQKFQVLGEPSEKEADVRILAATNRDLLDMIGHRQFRQDLFFRLRILEIRIPPLRERKADISDLVTAHMAALRGKKIGSGFWQALQEHDWPGNVRELYNVLTRAGVDAADPVTGKEIERMIRQTESNMNATVECPGFQKILKGDGDFWMFLWKPFVGRELNRDQLRRAIREFYERNEYSIKKAARAMRIEDADFKKFVALLHKYRIHPVKHLQV